MIHQSCTAYNQSDCTTDLTCGYSCQCLDVIPHVYHCISELYILTCDIDDWCVVSLICDVYMYQDTLSMHLTMSNVQFVCDV